MSLTDLIIIYLACGSPFGVYQITKRQPARARIDWFSVIASFLFWPANALLLVARRIFPSNEREAASRQNRLADLRLEIEALAFAGESISSLFEFREVFDRFVGLAEADNETRASNHVNEIFEISGHVNKSLASRCLARRNGQRLAFHRARVRTEYVDLISRMTTAEQSANQVIALALDVSNELADTSSMLRISRLLQTDMPVEISRSNDASAKVVA